jgi:meso-butanediol dehydrogenase/(S,S)-butanediol dehydrogenase/diacetyl reductase
MVQAVARRANKEGKEWAGISMTERFEGKVALVTGGVSGIGGAVTRRLLHEGATVIAVDISERSIDAFRNENSTKSLDTRRLDVSDSVAVTATVDAIAAHYGHIDVVFANAGVVGGGKLGDISDAEWERVLSVDLNGVFHVVRAALPYLIASKGAVVNTASLSGITGDSGMSAYDTAKGAVVNMTRSLAIDYGHDGVRINAVAPGIIATPMAVPILEQFPQVMDVYAERVPSGRIGQPEEVAAAMLFLASQDASYINGTILSVDGGLAAWSGQPGFF